MSPPDGSPVRRTAGPLASMLALLAVAGAAAALGPDRPDYRRAVVFAAAVCLTGCLGAWLVALRPAVTPAGRVAASLSVTALRIFPALLALGWLQAGGAALRDAGGGELLAVFYLAALAADLGRTIMDSRGPARARRRDDAI